MFGGINGINIGKKTPFSMGPTVLFGRRKDSAEGVLPELPRCAEPRAIGNHGKQFVHKVSGL